MTEQQLADLRELVHLVRKNEHWSHARPWLGRMVELCQQGVLDELIELYDHDQRMRSMDAELERASAENEGHEGHPYAPDDYDDMEIKP